MAVVEHVDPGTLPPTGARMLQHVYTSERKRGLSKKRASKAAWSAVARHYYKRGDRWHKRKRPIGTDEQPPEQPRRKRRNPSRGVVLGKPVKRAPVTLDGDELDDLGDALEVRTPTHVLRWKRGQPLLWSPKRKALVILQGASIGRRRAVANPRGRAARTFQAWAQRPVEYERTDSMPALREGWRRIGPAKLIAYWSDKFDSTDDYEHPITSRVTLYRAGGPRPPWVWVLRGGKLNVTARGIVG